MELCAAVCCNAEIEIEGDADWATLTYHFTATDWTQYLVREMLSQYRALHSLPCGSFTSHSGRQSYPHNVKPVRVDVEEFR